MEILHVGATGLVGRLVLPRLLAASQVSRVVAPTRAPVEVSDPRLLNPVVDFEALPTDVAWWDVDAVVCTLGTTMARAGSREAFRRVDRDYPLQVARHARQHGARVFALNSAMGADPESRVFYNRVKGELEAALDALGFPSLVMVRPGLIDGERQERRPGERAALVLSRVLRPLLPRGWRPSRAARIADALVAGVLAPTPGRVLVEAEALA